MGPPAPAHPDCQEDTEEEVELIKVNHARSVHIQHVKYTIDLALAEVSGHLHKGKELDICNNKPTNSRL